MSSVVEQPQTTKKRGDHQTGRALRYAKRLRARPLTPRVGTLPEDLRRWEEGGLEYLGLLDNVRPALAEARVYVLPSYREGTPRSVLEAMAMGRPVITCDAPGCRETVQDGVNGYLVPVRDPETLANRMREMIDDPIHTTKMGEESLRIAREKYDVRKVNKHLMEHLGLLDNKEPNT